VCRLASKGAFVAIALSADHHRWDLLSRSCVALGNLVLLGMRVDRIWRVMGGCFWIEMIEKRCVHAVSNDSKGEDCHSEGIAAIERVAAKQLGDGLVVVLCMIGKTCQFRILFSLHSGCHDGLCILFRRACRFANGEPYLILRPSYRQVSIVVTRRIYQADSLTSKT
jgi:hypothetical protein